MLKKISVLLLTLILALSVGCGKNKDKLSIEKGDDAQNSTTSSTDGGEELENGVLNPLTGLKDLMPEDANLRPVAVMINNLSSAQKVQTGLNLADIVYETEVEGGITRLLALYKDVKNVKQLGTVRSARYCFIDLAKGHDAIYVHHGQDAYHAQPHLKDVPAFTVSEKAGGARITNGLSREHTLYAYGDKLWEVLGNNGYNLEASSNTPWQTFTEKAKLSNTANSVSTYFSGSYITKFTYNPDTAKYTRYSGDTKLKDYVTEESIEFKNVFVLKTTIRNYNCTGSDTYTHKEVLLDSGSGYYFSNGKYEEINWSKGSASNGFVFTKADGTALEVTPGNSWVCIVNKNNKITIE